ncbi:MAG: glycosyltransferase family 4 protein [Candidatus Thiodiazotropha sp.]
MASSNQQTDKSSDIKILSVCETVKGGIATYLNLIDKYKDDGLMHRVILPDIHRDQLDSNSHKILYSGDKRGIARLISLFKTTRTTIKKWEPDLIYFHSSFTMPIMAMLRLIGLKSKIIYCAHGWGALSIKKGSLKRKLIEIIEGYLCGFANTAINISHNEINHARSVNYHGNHVVIENAVCEPTLPPRLADAKTDDNPPNLNLLFVGRFDRQKGLDILLDAFKAASVKRNDLHLHVIGDSVLHQYKTSISDTENVTFYGWLSSAELEKHFSRADIVIVPSRWEGFGLVVAESMRAGTPVMVSDKGSLPGLVDEGVTGYITQLNVSMLSEKLISLSKSKLDSLRDNCYETYKNRFSAKRYISEFKDLYENLCMGK